jgi:hypothetical protein
MTRYHCKPSSGNPGVAPLVFEWDELAGTLSGQSAAEIMQHIEAGGVPLHPMPGSHTFGPAPLKSRTDMAAIIGYLHELPAELADAYPVGETGPVTAEYLDTSGRVVASAKVIY